MYRNKKLASKLTSKQVSEASHGAIIGEHKLDPLGKQISSDWNKKITLPTHLSQPLNSLAKLAPFNTQLPKPLDRTHSSSQEHHLLRHCQPALSDHTHRTSKHTPQG